MKRILKWREPGSFFWKKYKNVISLQYLVDNDRLIVVLKDYIVEIPNWMGKECLMSNDLLKKNKEGSENV